MTKDNLIVLLGPTAVGKTELSLNIAENFKGEIVSSDSMQIYKYMDIGSAKASKDEMDRVRHHMIDIVYPDEEFSVSDYKNQAKAIIRDINKRDMYPLVTGGTGLYINSLVYDLNFTKVEANYELREELEKEALEFGNEYAHNKLREIDPESASKIHPNDLKRVIRALEIYRESGQTMTDFNKDFRRENQDYNLAMIGLTMDREKLYNRINQRVDLMMENGLLDEVKSIMDMGYSKDLVALQGIGYKELILYLEGQCSLEESVELIKKKSRNYAKRQLTWFRRDERIIWFNKDEYSSEEELSKAVIESLDLIFNKDGRDE